MNGRSFIYYAPHTTDIGRWVCINLSSPLPHLNHVSAFFFKSCLLRPFPFGYHLPAYFTIVICGLPHLSLSTICSHVTLLSTIYHWRSWHLAHHHLLCPAIILSDLKVHTDKPFVTLASQFLNFVISSNLYFDCTLSLYIQGYDLWFVLTRVVPSVKFNMRLSDHNSVLSVPSFSPISWEKMAWREHQFSLFSPNWSPYLVYLHSLSNQYPVTS